MKQLTINIHDCTECPYCKYTDQYDGYRAEDLGREPLKEGFYCSNMHPRKFIAEYYNDYNGNALKIPTWCKLKEAEV